MSRFYYVPDVYSDLSCRETLSDSDDDEAILKEWSRNIAAQSEVPKTNDLSPDTGTVYVKEHGKLAEPVVSPHRKNIQKLSCEVLEQYPSIVQLLPLSLNPLNDLAQSNIDQQPYLQDSSQGLQLVPESDKDDRNLPRTDTIEEPFSTSVIDIERSSENEDTSREYQHNFNFGYDDEESFTHLSVENESINLTMDNNDNFNNPDLRPSTSTPVSSSRSIEAIISRETISAREGAQEFDAISLSPIERPVDEIRDSVVQEVPSVDADFHMERHLRDNVDEVYDDSESSSDENSPQDSTGSLDSSASLFLNVTIEE